ncbi:hypothetical protein CVU76_01770 [Candidatus Dojkabacteria bacterium HGW-Dojkabacteria-1]|uniref:Transglutaminase-like domain-containing protein n=1 Tax=Candidatus Dojkabacteria bacterium HGW-Dojkabacteria-1 TaxID=2013761 RepID=A0A2N2F3E7_9BACT|nr:MAG: hypothetical protein CVU76_01770 [Candidatus Dojkabacteria bacterium HGW-Dojkabacteria-1]
MRKDITMPNDEIISITKNFSKNKYKAIFESMFWIKKNLEKMDYDRGLFRKRDASEIVKSKKFMGCTDVGLVFISLMRSLGIKATYMETISEGTLVDFIKYPDKEISISGHIFVRVEIEDISMIVDPMTFQILLINNLPAHSMFSDAVIIAEGKDFVELDMNSEEKIRKNTIKFVKKTFK